MHGLDTSFSDLEELSRTGAGPVLRGRRQGRAHLVFLLVGTPKSAFSPDMIERLRHPAHAAVAPVEVVTAEDGVGLATAAEGRLLSEIAGEIPEGPLVPEDACLEIASTLAEAAAQSAAAGLAIGPLTWSNVLLDVERPAAVRVVPLGVARRSATDWLSWPVEESLFVDRDTLRLAPGPRSDAFGPAALLWLLWKGRAGLPRVEGDAEWFIRRAVVETHSLRERVTGDDALSSLVAGALEGTAPLDGAEAVVAALDAIRASRDPQRRALALRSEGKLFDAHATLHRAARGPLGRDGARLLLLKAALEREQGFASRAGKTLRQALALAPDCRDVLLAAGSAPDAPDAVATLEHAVALDPVDPLGYARLARARLLVGEHAAALREVAIASRLIAADPRDARGRLELARFFFDEGALRVFGVEALGEALRIADSMDGAAGDVGADALELSGRVRYKLQAYRGAARRLLAAMRRTRRSRRSLSVDAINECAFSLSALRHRRCASRVARISLEIDADQPTMKKFLRALGYSVEADGPEIA